MEFLRSLLTKAGRKAEPPPLAPKVSAGLRTTILTALGAQAIPVMPSSAERAFKVAIDPTADLRDFIEVIAGDESLSARIVRIANSVFFDRGTPSSTLEDAAQIIGLTELRSLLNATALSGVLPSRHPLRRSLWEHNIAVAIIARHLARSLLPSRADEAFLAGLMHDVGKLLLIQRLGDEYAKLLRKMPDLGVSSIEAERTRFAFDHTDVGALIGERWHFSPELIAVIQSHHSTPRPHTPHGGRATSLTQLVAHSNIVAHAIGAGHIEEFAPYRAKMRDRIPGIATEIGIAQDCVPQFIEEMQAIFERERELLLVGASPGQ